MPTDRDPAPGRQADKVLAGQIRGKGEKTLNGKKNGGGESVPPKKRVKSAKK